MRDETKCLHSGYTPKNGEPRVMPIVQSTTYVFDSTEHIGQLFDMPTEYMYSRFANPTVDAVEKKIADLEGRCWRYVYFLRTGSFPVFNPESL